MELIKPEPGKAAVENLWPHIIGKFAEALGFKPKSRPEDSLDVNQERTEQEMPEDAKARPEEIMHPKLKALHDQLNSVKKDDEEEEDY